MEKGTKVKFRTNKEGIKEGEIVEERGNAYVIKSDNVQWVILKDHVITPKQESENNLIMLEEEAKELTSKTNLN
jgi:RNase P/RNase MRP subunit p29